MPAVPPPPLHPPKVEPVSGVAARTTLAAVGRSIEQVPVQPPGAQPTAPAPLPAKTILRVKVAEIGLKLATTERSALMSTTHAPTPVQSPPHPVNAYPGIA